jgi:DNA-binding PadR family transcriptional regulator
MESQNLKDRRKTNRSAPQQPELGQGPTAHLHGRAGALHIGRMVADGDLRLVVLSLIDRSPRHGYDIIKAIEELTSGSYSPSPGVIYPTLAAVEAAGQATVTILGQKRIYAISSVGRDYLTARRIATDGILEHLTVIGGRIARSRQWRDRGEMGRRSDRPERDIPDVIPELNEARRVLKAALASKIDAPSHVHHAAAAILARAAAEISALGLQDEIDP